MKLWKIAGALALSALFGCKTETTLESFPLAEPVSTETSTAKKRQSFLEQIIEKTPYIGGVFYYDESQKEKYLKTAEKEYCFTEKDAIALWTEIGRRKQQAYGLTIMPRDLTGAGKNSIIFSFPVMFENSKNTDDISSYIVDHESHHAKDNALGIELCGEKITPEKIPKIPIYYDILELRAYSNQITNMGKRQVSEECKRLIATKYFTIFWQLFSISLKNEYAKSAILQESYLPLLDVQTKNIVIVKK